MKQYLNSQNGIDLHMHRPILLAQPARWLAGILRQIFAIALLLSGPWLGVASAQTVNWMSWTAPASYPGSNTTGRSYTYASGASGSLTLPDTTVVTATLTGEVLSDSCFTTPCTGWWGGQSWSLIAPAGTYTSTNVPSLPPNNHLIAQAGYVPAVANHVLTFSQPVQNVVMNIMSLGAGAGAVSSSYVFDQDFVILSQSSDCVPSSGVNCLRKNGRTLTGIEGMGTIQFVGQYSSISWTVSAPEYFSGFNIGVTSNTPPPTYTVGGSVSGLASGQSLVLRNSNGDSSTVNADGSFTFSTAINSGSTYAVTVSTQPTGQTCTVANGTGTATANVSNVAVTCTTNYTVGGTVTGLASGQSVVLRNNNSNSTTVNADGSFTFSTPIGSGSTYAVTVSTQPTGKTCTVANGTGTATANVTNISITCVSDVPAPIPTLSEWVMFFLASLMAMFAIRRMRHQ